MPSLTITGGPLEGQQFSFSESVIIGRGAYCDVRIDDSTVSRRHAEICVNNDGSWHFHDLGSANGSLLKGKPIHGNLKVEGTLELVIGEVPVRLDLTEARAARSDDNSSFPQLLDRLELLAWTAALPARRESPAQLIEQILDTLRDAFSGCTRVTLFVTRPGSSQLLPFSRQAGAAPEVEQRSAALAKACQRHVDGVAGGASVIQPLGVADAPAGILAAPVILSGETLGILVAESERSDTWSTLDRSLGKGIASVIGGLLEAERGSHSDRQGAERDLLLARRVQQHFLPQNALRQSGFQFAESYVPARVVGGDHYDYFRFSDDRIGIVIGDVSGKAVSAALVMARFGMAVRLLASQAGNPLDLLVTLNVLLLDELEGGMFVTAQIIAIDAASGDIEIANAGHPSPLLRNEDGTVEAVTLEPGAPLGASAQTHFGASTINLRPGASLLFYTDGLDEAENEEGQQFGIERPTAALAKASDAPGILAEINQQLGEFVGSAKATDDLTLLAISRDAVDSPVRIPPPFDPNY
ncbi:MAG TPA: SpoIIE family protein phosphatase [Dokdonella sp.]|uniref:SpoIIE family protein phosphatase n=1 Tax=Dokdonella sp. TaxID=2291710 RepID=UPI002D81035F|nr:SpoIIE family protein phosphatase [Dokdonella sp.]HET9032486.1 SpoIIE family protein phosphatase [Dokdonella sp.]